MKKKLMAMVMVAASILTMSGCDTLDKAMDNLSGNTKWMEDAKDSVPDSITSENAGKIYILGEEYEFPMRVSDLLDTGWEYSNRYTNLKGTTLKAGYELDEFEMYKSKDDNDDYIQIKIYNDKNEEISVDDALVTQLEIGWQMCDEVMIAGGIYMRQSEDDFKKAIDDLSEDFKLDDSEEFAAGSDTDVYNLDVTGKDGYTYNLLVDVNTYGEHEVFKFRYILKDSVDNYGEIEDKEGYLNAFMQTIFHDDDSNYVDVYGSKVDASDLRESYIDYCAECIAYYLDVDYSSMEMIEKSDYQDFAIKTLNGTKWEISVDDNTMNISFLYGNLAQVLDTAYDNAYNKICTMYTDEEMEAMTDEEYEVVIDKFEALLSDNIRTEIKNITFTETTDYSFTIDRENVISDDDLYNVILISLGFKDYIGDETGENE